MANPSENFVRQESEVEDVPEWLNEKFVERTLRKYLKDDGIDIDHIVIRNCAAKGDHYFSLLFRVAAYYLESSSSDVKSKFLVVKGSLDSEMAVKVLEGIFGVQKKEMTFYNEIVPQFEEILAQIDEDGKTFPTVIAVYEDLNVFVLEDMREKNFVMTDRFKGLDEAHMKVSLKALARMHAASLVLLEKDPKAFEGFQVAMFNEKIAAYDIVFTPNLLALTDEVASWSEWDKSSYFADKLKNIQRSFMDNCLKIFERSDKNLNVLMHGDMWTNNLLFNYDINELPAKAIVLDFQYSYYGAATLDLLYFFFTSLTEDLKSIDKMEEMVQFYFYELKSLLEKLNFDMKKLPSLHEFQTEFFRNFFFGFTVCLVLCPIHANQENDANFENLADANNSFKRRIFRNPRIKKIAMEWLPFFDQRGLFDGN